MATYKVPQDVEADDKLLGPFTFRQFVYLMIVFGLIMLMVGLFQIFPLLAIIPIPVAIFFAILALPLKKDQPMETYFAALLSFYLKPNKRYWMPGQSESTILITAPKKVEASRARDITEDEASHRLSFLAEIIDSEGHAIKNASTTMKDDFYAEAYNTTDMFERNDNYNLNNLMTQQQDERRAAVVNQMRDAIANSEYNIENRVANGMIQLPNQRVIQPRSGFTGSNGGGFSPSGAPATISGFESPVVVTPDLPPIDSVNASESAVYQDTMTNLANNPDLSVAAIEQTADRVANQTATKTEENNNDEVFVSLH